MVQGDYIIDFKSGKKVEESLLNTLGSKFKNLLILNEHMLVPKAICVRAEYFNSILKKYIEKNNEFLTLFKDLESTAGCYLLDTYPKIKEVIDEFKIDEEERKELKTAILEHVSEDKYYAVRSSASHEDSSSHSFAGVYNTALNVQGIDNIIDAMENSIKEYYSYSAIVARIRTYNYSPYIELNIIIQEMVNGEISGVAFTASEISKNKVLVEWVKGLGEQLVSGEEEAYMYIEGEETEYNKEVLDTIVQKAKKIKEILGFEADVEWTYFNGEVYILQSRPITDKNVAALIEKKNVFKYDRLYFESNLAFKDELGKCKRIYENYTEKRGPIYLLARKNDINFGYGYVIKFNMKGLEENKEEFKELFNHNYCEKVDIDIDDSIRQNIIKKDDVYQYIYKMFEKGNWYEEHTIIIREFISGQAGCISRLIGDNVLVEYSTDGLLSMNRGIADCKDIYIENQIEENDTLSYKALRDIQKFTKEIGKTGKKNMIEWSICDEKAYFIDLSTEVSSDGIKFEKNVTKNKIIVPGNFEGQVLQIDKSDIMERLSVSPGVSVNEINYTLAENPDLKNLLEKIKGMDKKPIIVVDKPYAVLSFLFDYVEGFVFRKGSLLCHLSIMLREYKIPSIICKDIDNVIKENKQILVSEGRVMGV